jgi:hypothetical protein
MKKVDLVFRSIGRAYVGAALELALRNIRPDNVHLIENVSPFSEAVRLMLDIDYDADYVVVMDADCLIMEDMTGYLQQNEHGYVDCFLLDKFRGNIHCGVHITRIDLMRAMRNVIIDPFDYKFVLRPESRTRFFALRELGLGKNFHSFRIFHDFEQSYADVFAKYALRELRSRTRFHSTILDTSMQRWKKEAEHDTDYRVALHAVEYARNIIVHDTPYGEIEKLIANLQSIAKEEVAAMGISEKAPLTMDDVKRLDAKEHYFMPNPVNPDIVQNEKGAKARIFGIGLSRTGTKSLSRALKMLGITVRHYPADEQTYNDLIHGNYRLTILDECEAITDITVSQYYAQLDRAFPGSKFILTVRDRESWLRSMEKHWKDKPVYSDDPEEKTHMKMRRFLRAAVYGVRHFNSERLSFVYDLHYRNVIEYFKDKPDQLLVLNITRGEGWDKLCPFLERPIPVTDFPYVNDKKQLLELNR